MAKTSKIVKNEERKDVAKRHAARRAELKRLVSHPDTPDDERDAAVVELQKQPRDASRTRVRNRDSFDGRPRGFVRDFGVSRIKLRDLAHAGYLPGVRKSSW